MIFNTKGHIEIEQARKASKAQRIECNRRAAKLLDVFTEMKFSEKLSVLFVCFEIMQKEYSCCPFDIVETYTEFKPIVNEAAKEDFKKLWEEDL